MKKMLMMAMLLGAIGMAGCQKKDEGAPAGPPPCGDNHTFAPGFGRCVFNGHCQLGMVQHIAQPTMCADARTGMVVETQRCATGYMLTTSGCAAPCPTNPSLALVGNSCVQPASGTSGYYNVNQQQMGQQPAYQSFPSYYGQPANSWYTRYW